MRDEAHNHANDAAAQERPPARLWLWLLLSALSGVLFYLSFPPVDIGPLAFVAFVPLLVAVVRARSYPAAALCGAAAGAAACWPAFAWLGSVGTPAWLGMGFYAGTYFVAAALAFRHLQRSLGAFWPLLAAATWVGLEVSRAHLGPGFPWLFVGYTQYRFLPLAQAAAVGGVFAVSFIVLLVNAALAGLLTGRAALPRRIGVLALAAAVLGGAALAGRAAIAGLPVREGPVVGIIQQNVPRLVSEMLDEGKTDEQSVKKLSDEMGKAVALTEHMQGSGARLVLWPETTVQIPLNTPLRQPYQDLAERTVVEIRRLGRLLDAYMLVGAPTYVAPPGGEAQSAYGIDVSGYANSALYLSPDGQLIGRYDKIRLVPFGEYIPLRNLFPFLQAFTPMTRDIVGGTDEVVFDLPARDGGRPTRFSALICYEDVFPDLTADFRRKGADFMVNLTDEGWYTIPGELGQHLAMAVFRAIETRTTVVRAANTGVSCFIDPSGRVYADLKPLTEDALSAPVKVCPVVTPYVRWGDVFGIACLMLAIGLPALLAAARRAS